MSSLNIDTSDELGLVSTIGHGYLEFKARNVLTQRNSTKYGTNFNRFNIGQYLVTEGTRSVTLCQLTSLSANIIAEDESSIGSTVKCQILGSYSTITNRPERGVIEYPKVGQKIFHASKEVVQLFIPDNQCASEIGEIESLELNINIPFDDLYSKHCAVIGNTGGGKSWTIGRLIEQNLSNKIKTILLDATGEFHKLIDEGVSHFILAGENSTETIGTSAYFDYKQLTIEDMFAFFTPSAQAQAAVLREAIKTLKLIEAKLLAPNDGLNNFLKNSSTRTAYENALARATSDVLSQSCNFDITALQKQIENECIDTNTWVTNNQMKNWQQTLLMRIETRLNSPELSCIFKPDKRVSLIEKLDAFIKDDKKYVFRISLKDLPFDFYTREIVVNALTRYLLSCARQGKFKQTPTVLAVDEAHNFFKAKAKIGDDFITFNTLDLIAKEGRKFGLLLLIGTQRPKDIPTGAMSQIGSVFCHRLTNEEDTNIIKYSLSEFNRSLLAQLPLLKQGEAILVNHKLPFPITIEIKRPKFPPDSNDPKLHKKDSVIVSTPQVAKEFPIPQGMSLAKKVTRKTKT